MDANRQRSPVEARQMGNIRAHLKAAGLLPQALTGAPSLPALLSSDLKTPLAFLQAPPSSPRVYTAVTCQQGVLPPKMTQLKDLGDGSLACEQQPGPSSSLVVALTEAPPSMATDETGPEPKSALDAVPGRKLAWVSCQSLGSHPKNS